MMFLVYLIELSLMSVSVSSTLVSRFQSKIPDDPFMDPYIQTILSMDNQQIISIPKLSDAEFIEFLNDDSRANFGEVALRKDISLWSSSVDDELIYGDNAEREWESLMVAGPLSIQYVGNLMVLSSAKDFAFRAANYSYENIKFPNSFRATLAQVSGDMYNALLLAHTSMDKIQLNIRQIPNQIKTVFKLVTTSSNTMIKSQLPRTLTTIMRLANDNAIIANSTKSSFHQLQKLLTEIVQVSALTHSVHQTDIDLVQEQQANMTREEQDFQRRLESIKNEYDESKANIAALRQQYNDIMKQASEAEPQTIQTGKWKQLLQIGVGLFSPTAGAILCVFTSCHTPTVKVDNTKFENLFALSQSIRADLEKAMDNHKALHEQYMLQQSDMMRLINNMASLDLSKLSHTEIIELLVKAIEQISHIEEQWSRLMRFFFALSNRAESVERVIVQDFIGLIGQANADGILDEIMHRQFFTEIVVPIIESIQTEAHLLFVMAATYYTVSGQYMVNQIASINRLLVLQTDDQRNDHLRQVSSDALATSISVSTMVQARSAQYLAEVESRRDMYTNYMNNLLQD